ncbi:MAG: hypothetical protein DME08_01035 [Candidatus Rokuibacteriota bacterium]|nr:MAG: hypothetical protein DME08_01035 [Candidatus Rokubacteria bacterium]
MTNEEWFEGVTSELVARSPFRRSEYFKRFASGALPTAQAWVHLSQHYLLIAWFPRIFSGIHARCDDLDVRKDCARHLLVEDLGYFEGKVGGTPDHDELYRRIGDDLGYPRSVYATITPIPEMAAIVDYFKTMAHELPWSASLCATALIEEEVGREGRGRRDQGSDPEAHPHGRGPGRRRGRHARDASAARALRRRAHAAIPRRVSGRPGAVAGDRWCGRA